MRDFYFDKLIREKLGNAEVPLNQEDWLLMEDALNVSEGETGFFEDQPVDEQFSTEEGGIVESLQNKFDQLIHDRLADLNTEPFPEDWDLMVADLDGESFDQQISDKLASHTADYQPADWHLMAAHLDGHPVDTAFRKALEGYEMPYRGSDWYHLADRLAAPFDQAIRQNLDKYHLGFSIKDWRMMAAMLNQAAIGDVREPAWYANWRNYLSAASVVLLLLISGFWLRDRQTLTRPDKEYVEYFAPVFNPDQQSGSETISIPWQQASVKTPERGVIRPVNKEDNFSSGQIAQSNAESLLNVEGIEFNGTPLPDKVTGKINSNPVGEPTVAQSTQKELKPRRSLRFKDQIVHALSGPHLSLALPVRQPGVYKVPSGKVRKQPELRIGIIGGNTSTKAELDDRPEPGFMVGTRIELLINDDWSVVSGLHYARKEFQYEYQIFAPQRFDRTVDASFSILEAPILVRYNFPSTTPLNLYALGGVVTSVSIAENYWEYDPRSPDNTISRSQLRRSSPTDERNFNTYVGNIYVAGGLEYKFNSTYALQVEPYFQMNMQKTKGSGARGFEKRLYTSGLSVSLMYNLSKKSN